MSIEILIVDDEPLNTRILETYLQRGGYAFYSVQNGAEAWALLDVTPNRFHAILLDRMMPVMDGIELLKKIKADKRLEMLPVIMQTAATGREAMLEGIEAGAHYYLAKPFEEAVLLALLRAAINEYALYLSLSTELSDSLDCLPLMEMGKFRFRTLTEAKKLAVMIARLTPRPQKVVVGLTELMINAVEHGNLGINYADKTRLVATGKWKEEVSQRLDWPENKEKYAVITLLRLENRLILHIHDQGKGFNWQEYLEFNPNRAFDTHGRGIAMARMLSFDEVRYQGLGNEVEAVVYLEEAVNQEIACCAASS